MSAVMLTAISALAIRRSPPAVPDVIVLTGPNVVGKSTLMMRWGRDRYDEWTRSAAHDQVLAGPCSS